MPYADAAAEESGVIGQAVVGYLEITVVSIDNDAAARIRTANVESINPGFAVSGVAESLIAGRSSEHQDSGPFLIP